MTGTVDSIVPLHQDTYKIYDLQYNRISQPKTTIHTNPEFNFNRDERFVSK